MSLEPRLSTRWIINAAFLGHVVSLPVPAACFSILDSKAPSTSTAKTVPISYLPYPPPLNVIIESIAPSVFSRETLVKGLNAHSEPLVVHCTALALAKIIAKYERVIEAFQKVEDTLEEAGPGLGQNQGLWTKRRLELETLVRKRLPEFHTIVTLSQKYSKHTSTPTPAETISLDTSMQHADGVAAESTSKTKLATPSSAAISLISEIALRLMFLYHQSLSSSVAEYRFDVGGLLGSVCPVDNNGAPMSDGPEVLSQLHVLRLLKTSDQFTWTSKPSTSVLEAFLSCSTRAYGVIILLPSS